MLISQRKNILKTIEAEGKCRCWISSLCDVLALQIWQNIQLDNDYDFFIELLLEDLQASTVY